jgi:biotin carboxyl carrier protein
VAIGPARPRLPGQIGIVPVLIDDCDPDEVYLGLDRIRFVDFRLNRDDARKKLLARWGIIPATPGASSPPIVPTNTPLGIVLESPMTGTFYCSASPDAPMFVRIGSAVHPETIVCVIESMKVFTDIPAGVSGTITEILVKNGKFVEIGQALFRVNPA